jgi:RimJ/RimL family protein N-acetyltransferase
VINPGRDACPRIASPQNRLRDDAIRLAPPELEDAATVLEWDADSEIQHWYDWPATPPADDPQTYAARLAAAERTVRSQRASWDEGEQFTFVIHSATTGEGLGWVDLQPRGSGRGNVAYGVIARHRGKGHATRGVRLAVSYAFDVLGWIRLDLATVADNVASRAVALKTGFHLEGVLRSYGAYERYQPLLGKRFDWAIHGLLSTDPRG